MTRPIQKQEELCSLKHIFKRLGIVHKAIHCGNDPPDFLVALEEQEIALELTAYHLDGQRREVEEHWGKICTAWSEMQKVYPELAKVDVCLVLKKFRLPAPKNYSQFLQDLAKSIRDMQHRSGQNEENFFPSSDRHPELARFVAKVEIAAVEFHGGLDCDKSFAYTGLTEYDLIRLRRRKLLAPYIQGPKLRWLFVYGGPSISPITGIMLVSDLRRHKHLLKMLNTSQYDEVYLCDEQILHWSRDSRWRECVSIGR